MKIRSKIVLVSTGALLPSLGGIATSCTTNYKTEDIKNIFNIKDGVLLGLKEQTTKDDIKASIKNGVLSLPQSISIASNAFNNDLFKTLPNDTTIEIKTKDVADYAFYGTNATKFTIASGVSLETIGKSAFAGSSTLTEFTFPSTLKSLGAGAFAGCSAIAKLDFSGFTTTTELDGLKFGNTTVFSGCKTSGNIVVHDATVGASVFTKCNDAGLSAAWTQVDTSGQPIEEIKIVPDYFYEYTSSGENTVDITGFKRAVERDGRMANYNTMIIPETLGGKTVVNIQDNSFYSGIASYISSIKRVVLPKTLTRIGVSNFAKAENLVSIETNEPSALTTIASDAFAGSTHLSSVCFDKLTNLKDIGDRAFEGCTSLESANLTNTKVKDLTLKVFDGCTGLTSVVLPQTLVAIASGAFTSCTGLTSISIPSNVLFISKGAFTSSGLITVSFDDLVARYDVLNGSSKEEIYVADKINAAKQLVSGSGIYKHLISFKQDVIMIANTNTFYDWELPYQAAAQWSSSESQQYTVEWSKDGGGTIFENDNFITDPEEGKKVYFSQINQIDEEETSTLTTITANVTYKDYFTSTTTTDQYKIILRAISIKQGGSTSRSNTFNFEFNSDTKEYKASISTLGVASKEQLRIPDVVPYNDGSLILPSYHGYFVTEIADNGFSSSQFQKVRLPATLKTIGAGAFTNSVYGGTQTGVDVRILFGSDEYNHQLNYVYPGLTIGANAFNGCGFKAITLPCGLETIKAGTFVAADGKDITESITLPSTLKTIEAGAFGANNTKDKIIDATSLSTPPTLGGEYSLPKKEIVTIKVRKQFLEAFQTAWSAYSDRIVGVE